MPNFIMESNYTDDVGGYLRLKMKQVEDSFLLSLNFEFDREGEPYFSHNLFVERYENKQLALKRFAILDASLDVLRKGTTK